MSSFYKRLSGLKNYRNWVNKIEKSRYDYYGVDF